MFTKFLAESFFGVWQYGSQLWSVMVKAAPDSAGEFPKAPLAAVDAAVWEPIRASGRLVR